MRTLSPRDTARAMSQEGWLSASPVRGWPFRRAYPLFLVGATLAAQLDGTLPHLRVELHAVSHVVLSSFLSGGCLENPRCVCELPTDGRRRRDCRVADPPPFGCVHACVFGHRGGRRGVHRG